MCHLNCTTKKEKYKHITYAERTMIETWYNQDKKSKKEIAELLHKSERTIRREINRGKVIIRGYEWEDKTEYSARIAQDKYDYGMTGKGPELKLDQDIKIVEHIRIKRKRLLILEENIARMTLEILLYLKMCSGTVEE